MGTSSNYALRLPASLKKAAEGVAREDGTTLNQFIVTAVAEKVASLKTQSYFAQRAERADLAAFDRFMSRAAGALPSPEDRWDDPMPDATVYNDGGKDDRGGTA